MIKEIQIGDLSFVDENGDKVSIEDVARERMDLTGAKVVVGGGERKLEAFNFPDVTDVQEIYLSRTARVRD